ERVVPLQRHEERALAGRAVATVGKDRRGAQRMIVEYHPAGPDEMHRPGRVECGIVEIFLAGPHVDHEVIAHAYRGWMLGDAAAERHGSCAAGRIRTERGPLVDAGRS